MSEDKKKTDKFISDEEDVQVLIRLMKQGKKPSGQQAEELAPVKKAKESDE